MGEALANRLPRTGVGHNAKARSISFGQRPDDSWTARQTLTFVVSSSALLWMIILQTARVL